MSYCVLFYLSFLNCTVEGIKSYILRYMKYKMSRLSNTKVFCLSDNFE